MNRNNIRRISPNTEDDMEALDNISPLCRPVNALSAATPTGQLSLVDLEQRSQRIPPSMELNCHRAVKSPSRSLPQLLQPAKAGRYPVRRRSVSSNEVRNNNEAP